MAHPNESTIQQAIAVIHDAEQEVDKLLSDANLSTAKIGVVQTLRQAANRLAGLAGIATSPNITTPANEQPATIFGQPVNRREPVAPALIQPTDTEKEALRERVEAFSDSVVSGKDDDLLKVLQQPQGELIVRGAAKLAGVKDWQSADLTVQFIQQIREAREQADEVAEQEAKAKEAAAKAKTGKK